MNTFIVLLRGINVGGKSKLPMAKLVEVLESSGFAHVRTYIQSGNVVLRSRSSSSSHVAKDVRSALARECGIEPEVMALTTAELENAINANPFPHATEDPQSLHFFFLASSPEELDDEALEAKRSESERYAIVGNIFYLFAPDGIGRSKLAASVERLVGVPVTARNWRTVNTIMEMARLDSTDR